MSQSLRTPNKTTRGLGAAREGADHFIQQRVTALALLALVPWFLYSIVTAYEGGYLAGKVWISNPINAVFLALALTAAFFHMRLGVQTVIEDYISKHGTRSALLILNTFAVIVMWALSVFSILRAAL